MAINIAFAGSRIKRPGAYSTVDTSGMTPVTLGAFNVLAFVGKASAEATIAPKKVVYFNEPSNAREALKDGDLLAAAEAAWKHGADLIAFVRVDDATKAAGAITVAAEDIFDLTAKAFGTGGNAVSASVEDIGGKLFITLTQGELEEQFEIKNGVSNADLAADITKKSQLVDAVAATATAIVAAVPPVSLAGGTGGGAVTDADWQSAIDTLAVEDINGVVAVTTEAAIQAKVATHVNTLSNTKNRRERRAFYGHAAGASIDDIISVKLGINSERGVLASPAVGADSVQLAAAYAGLWASKEPQDPITYDYVQVDSIEKRYSADEIEQLLGAGVAVTEFVAGRGYRVVQGITTASGDDLTQVELSVSTLKDVMSRNMREMLENKHVGNAGVAGIEVTIYNDAMSQIQNYLRAGWVSEYVDGSLKVTKEGTAYRVDWEGKPTLPINNFLITARFTL